MILTYTNFGVRDIKVMIALCESWWYEADFYKNTGMEFATDEQYWWNLFQAGVMTGRLGRNEKGELKACYAAMIHPYMFNQQYKMSSEIVWCIDEEYRSGSNLLQLLSEIEQCNKDNETDIYNLNVPVFNDNDRLISKLQKHGFFKQDTSMLKMTNYSENEDG